MRKILVLKEGHIKNDERLTAAAGSDFIVEFAPRGSAEYRKKLQDAEVIIGEPTIEELHAAKQLKWLQITAAGSEYYVRDEDFPRTILFSNMSGAFGETISEYVIGGILALYRRFPDYFRNQAKKQWKDMGSERTLAEKTVLILGAGDIGTCVARKLCAFGTKNIGVRRVNRSYEGCFEEMHTLADVDSLLPEADIVVGCLPDTKATEGFFGKERLLRMRWDAILINVGRGSLIVTEDLIEVLENGHLYGVVLDVVSPEPLPAKSKLWEFDNVMITPHISGHGYGHEIRTENKVYDIITENIRRYREGKPVLNQVDLKSGYRKTNVL